MRTIEKMRPGFYRILHGEHTSPDAMIWRECEGPDSGKWFFDLASGNGVSEPYDTLKAAYSASRTAVFGE